MSRLQEPRRHPAQPTAAAESSALRRRGREARTLEFRGRSWSSQKRGYLEDKSRTLRSARFQEPTPASRDSGAPRPLARLGNAASLGATLERPGRPDSASLGVSSCWTRCLLPKRSCPASVIRTRSIPRNRPPATSRPGISPPSDSATSIEAAFAVERDVARRLAQRCTPQPHSIALLHNSLLRMRLSLPRFITSLALSCASNMPGRGREVQAE